MHVEYDFVRDNEEVFFDEENLENFEQKLLTENIICNRMIGHKMLCLALCPFLLQTVSRQDWSNVQEFPRWV